MLTFTTFFSSELTKPFLQSFYNVTLNFKNGTIIKVSVGNMLHADIVYADIVYVPVYYKSLCMQTVQQKGELTMRDRSDFMNG